MMIKKITLMIFNNNKHILIYSSFSKWSTIDFSGNKFGKINKEPELEVYAEFNLEYLWFNKTKNFDLDQLENLFTKFSPFFSHCLKEIEVNGTGIDSNKAEKILKSQGYKADVVEDDPEIN